jgi:monoamine oxidase
VPEGPWPPPPAGWADPRPLPPWDAGAAPMTRVGHVHFAGADYSAEWPGYMDGAIRSGEQAAQRALAEL